ncbi:MAG: flavoprotein [Thermomicrobiales bacterium]
MSVLRNARIVLGVTGGIAAYKAIDLASKLVQSETIVHVILTESAAEFVGAASFEAITQQPVHRSVFEAWRSDWHGHVSLGQMADLIVVAPRLLIPSPDWPTVWPTICWGRPCWRPAAP